MILQHQQNTVNVYDFDDNIMTTNAGIRLYNTEKKEYEYFSTNDFKSLPIWEWLKYNFFDWEIKKDMNIPMNDFRDMEPDWQYKLLWFWRQLLDVLDWPRYDKFKQDLLNWNFFVILTWRWHDRYENILWYRFYIDNKFNKEEKEKMLQNIENKYKDNIDYKKANDKIMRYLEQNLYYNVNSPEFNKKFTDKLKEKESKYSSNSKNIWFEDLLSYINKTYWPKNLTINFSDDDPKNIEAMNQFLLSEHYKNVSKNWKYEDLKINLINTDNPKKHITESFKINYKNKLLDILQN